MATAIEFNNISKLYRLGVVGTGTLSHDIHRWWTVNVRRKEDPYLKLGSTNRREQAADSDYVWALKDISFQVEQGDVVGIIGKNGAGKSTLLKLLSRVTAPTTGTIRARGRIGSLLEVGTGFHPEMTGRENIYMNGAILGMTKAEISRKMDEIIDFSGCERYIDTPVKRYSSGMMVRLGFAVAAHLEPEILVVDEVLAVGDAEFQKKAIGKMQEVSRGEGRTVLFVSHNMASVQTLCKKGLLLNNGLIQTMGRIDDVIAEYNSQNFKISNNIADRIDRQGNQSLKVVDCYLQTNGKKCDTTNVGGTFDLIVAIQKNNADYRKESVNVSVNICNTLDQKVLQLSSKFINKKIVFNDDITLLQFSISKTPITYGSYYVRFFIDDGVSVLDWIDHAFYFTVDNGDYYGNGVIENSAMCMSDYTIETL